MDFPRFTSAVRQPVRGVAALMRVAALCSVASLASANPVATSPTTPVLSPLPPPSSTPEPRFDLSVHNAPAAQVLQQLAQTGRAAHWQVLVSPDVSGSVSLSLRDVSVPEVLEALRELYGYDIRVQGRRVLVQSNAVQSRLYRVSYLPGRRQGASEIRVSSSSITQAGSSGGSTGASGGTTSGSSGGGGMGTARSDDTAQIRTTSDADFWRDVQASLHAMLGVADTQATPRRSVVLNPASGVIVVRATPAEQRLVESYLKAVQLSIERQVMLEAKILEVELANDAQSGVNWSAFGRALGGALSLGLVKPGATVAATGALSADGASITPAGNLTSSATGRGFYGLAFQSTNFSALLNFLETQGRVQVLSSPRIATLNNQKAVLKVGSDELYVTGVSSTTTSSGSTSTTTPSVTLQPFFSGIALDVTPQIDDAGMVMLHVHPTISSVSEKQKAINLGSLGNYQLPLATSAINETDSIVRVRDGQIVAIGGLMRQERTVETTAVPGIGELPMVGGLFRQKATVVRKRELVILMKPTVIREDGSWPEADGSEPAARLQPFDDGSAPALPR